LCGKFLLEGEKRKKVKGIGKVESKKSVLPFPQKGTFVKETLRLQDMTERFVRELAEKGEWGGLLREEGGEIIIKKSEFRRAHPSNPDFGYSKKRPRGTRERWERQIDGPQG